MEKHAFLIMAHHEPVLLARILRILESNNHYFFVHVDKSSGNIQSFKEALQEIKNVIFVDSISVHHGDISQIYAILVSLKCALDFGGGGFSYFHVISGQDYPMRSNEQFDHFFEDNKDSYMWFDDYDKLPLKSTKLLNRRVMEYRPQCFSNYLKRLIFYGLGLPRFLSFLLPREQGNFHSGWDWFSLHISVVEYIMNYQLSHPEFLCRFVNTSAPSEIFFQTMLYPVVDKLHIHKEYPLRFCSHVAHRKVDTKYRPYNLNEEDFDYVIHTPSFFCRKVEEKESAKLMDLIDKQRGSDFDITQFTNIY